MEGKRSANDWKKLHRNIIADVPEEDRDHDVRRAQLREVAVGGHDLHDGLAAEVLVEELGDHYRHGQVLHALYDVAGHGHVAQQVPEVALENGLGHAQGYVRPHVEQGPAELLHRHRVHVAAHCQRREAGAPRLVVRPHSLEELVQVFLLETAIVIDVVQIPNEQIQSGLLKRQKMSFHRSFEISTMKSSKKLIFLILNLYQI